jgi:hypothetical protein
MRLWFGRFSFSDFLSNFLFYFFVGQDLDKVKIKFLLPFSCLFTPSLQEAQALRITLKMLEEHLLI